MRTPIQHDEDWDFIENPKDPVYNSTTYGITEQCPFNKLKYYHTCKLDAMHDLLEGYVKLCTNLLLKQFE